VLSLKSDGSHTETPLKTISTSNFAISSLTRRQDQNVPPSLNQAIHIDSFTTKEIDQDSQLIENSSYSKKFKGNSATENNC
jgi:hypothetical protein